jgi:hypothetical protein
LGPDYISWRKVPCLVNRGGFCPGQPGRLPESDAGSWGRSCPAVGRLPRSVA